MTGLSRGKESTNHGFGFALVGLLLAVSIGVFIAIAFVIGDVALTFFLLCALLFVGLLPIVWRILAHRSIDVFEPIYAIVGFYLLLFVLKPLALLLQSSPMARQGAFTLSILYALLGLVAFYVGYHAKLGAAISRCMPSLESRWSRSRLNWVAAIYGIATISILLVFVYRITGMGFLFHLTHSLQTHNEYFKKGAFWIGAALISLPSSSFFVLYAHSISSKVKRSQLALPFYFFLAVVVSLFVGLRWPIIVILTVPIILRHYYEQKRIRMRHLVLGIPVLLVLLTGLNYFRNYGRHMFDMLSLETLLGSVVQTILAALDPFQTSVEIIQSVPEKLGFQYGLYYVYTLLAPIPRALWPSKPVVSIEWLITETIYGQNPLEGPTVTPTLIGDLYLNFHVVGIVVGMFVWGLFWQAMYSYLLSNKKNIGVVLMYALLLLSGINVVRGSLGGFIIATLISLAPIVIAILYANGGRILKRRGATYGGSRTHSLPY